MLYYFFVHWNILPSFITYWIDLDKSKTFCVYLFPLEFSENIGTCRNTLKLEIRTFCWELFSIYTVIGWTHSFVVLDSADNLLGDGGFGNVYQMNYMGQDAAVKIFSAIGDIHPHKMLRQEVLWQGSY